MTHYVMWIDRFVDEHGLPMGFYKLKPLQRTVLRLPWLQGVSMAGAELGTVAMRVEDDDDEAGFFSDYVPGDVPLLSARLRDALVQAGVDNIEYFPTSISNGDDFDDMPEYVAFNVVGCLAVADAGRSRGNKAFGAEGATLFDHFEPAPGLAQAPPCFRSRESASTVVVSEPVRAACLAAGVDSLAFIPLTEWFS